MESEPELPGTDTQYENLVYTPTRNAGLARLENFVTHACRSYASNRHFDLGEGQRSNVSNLSPWIRHRLISEEEVIRETLSRFSASTAEKFIQEIFWRAYFKGWLEHHPTVWSSYKNNLLEILSRLDRNKDLSSRYHDAIRGETNLECFDHWVRELIDTGYLHNHARMWFASIWIFTLRLPWELGADFFLRYLIDGDPASNTLSWRWVAGLHTKGKTYRASRDNISKYTGGRFSPRGLSKVADPIIEKERHSASFIPLADPLPNEEFLLLLTEEDCLVNELLPRSPAGTVGLLVADKRSPLGVGPKVRTFSSGALNDAMARSTNKLIKITSSGEELAELVISEACKAGVKDVVTAKPAVGSVSSVVMDAKRELGAAGIILHCLGRDYDRFTWRHADRSFSKIKKNIPNIIQKLGILY